MPEEGCGQLHTPWCAAQIPLQNGASCPGECGLLMAQSKGPYPGST